MAWFDNAMKLTQQKLVNGRRPANSMQNPYDDAMPSSAGMQELQKPPVNLGPKPMAGAYAKPMTKPMSGAYAKPMYAPGTAQNPIDQGFTVDAPITPGDQSITPVDPKEDYFAQNAARMAGVMGNQMKAMKPDMYSMRKNRAADEAYQRPRSLMR